MTRLRLCIALAALAACAGRSRAPTPSTAPFTVGNVTVTPLGDGVYAAVLSEPLGLAVNANSLFIVNSDHVVIVDAQFTRQATLENLAALRHITHRPVRYVINTHWHDDHVAGNQVYQDTFPLVHFIAHKNTREDLINKGRENRVMQVQYAAPVANRFDRLLSLGLGGDSTPATPMERASLTSAVRIIRREAIVSTGDLVVAPIPFGFGSYPSEWLAVLDSVQALRPRVIVPGHGPVLWDLGYVKTVQRMLTR